jgi:hypothetical protein
MAVDMFIKSGDLKGKPKASPSITARSLSGALLITARVYSFSRLFHLLNSRDLEQTIYVLLTR